MVRRQRTLIEQVVEITVGKDSVRSKPGQKASLARRRGLHVARARRIEWAAGKLVGAEAFLMAQSRRPLVAA